MGVVYQATNKINGHRYIGATTRTMDIRRKHHISSATSGRHIRGCRVFGAAIRKHGPDNFVWEVLSQCDDRDELWHLEIGLIAEKKPEYNITKGGCGLNGIERTEGWYKKVSNSLKGRKPSLLAISRWKEVAPTLGRDIICLNDGYVGKGAEIAKKYGISKKTLYGILRGDQLSRGVWYFMWQGDCDDVAKTLAERRDRSAHNYRKGVAARKRRVVCLNNREIYESAAEAGRQLGVATGRVVQICHGEGKTRRGLVFEYV